MKRKYCEDDGDDTFGDVASSMVMTDQQIRDCGLSVIRISPTASAAAPFKGSGEFLDDTDDIRYYADLLQIIEPAAKRNDTSIYSSPTKLKKASGQIHWRRVLSSSYEPDTPILFKDKHYATLEHALAAIKFRDEHPEFADTFALASSPAGIQSDSTGTHVQSRYNLGSQVQFAKAAGSRDGKYKDGNRIFKRPEDIKYDQAYLEMSDDERRDLIQQITYSKYYGDEKSRNILLATRSALLIEGSGRKTKILVDLMNVRARLAFDLECEKKEAIQSSKD